MRQIPFIILIFIVFAGYTYAGENDSLARERYPVRIDGAWLRDFGCDFIKTGLTPLQWDGNSWMKFGGTTAVVGGLMLSDKELYKFIHDNGSPFIDNQSRNLFNDLWYVEYVVPVLGVVYAGGRIAKNDRLAFTALTAFRAFAVTTVFTGGFKAFFHRYRPNEHQPPDPWLWLGPSFSTDHLSFPSGHSSLSFALAAVVASEYSENKWVGGIAYGLAGLTAISRVYGTKHWPSDIVAGSVLGYAIGRFIHKRASGNTNKKDNKLVFSPVVMPFGGAGISLSYRL